MIGTLAGGALFSLQFEGAQTQVTGVQIDINGTDGSCASPTPAASKRGRNAVEGVNGDGSALAPLTVPADYVSLAKNHLDASVQDVAYLYAAYGQDRTNGTSQASNFPDAVRMHHFIDQISASSERFFSQA